MAYEPGSGFIFPEREVPPAMPSAAGTLEGVGVPFVAVVHLPEIGIRGNTHFPFSDLNNLEIADLLSRFLEKNGLD